MLKTQKKVNFVDSAIINTVAGIHNNLDTV